MRFHGRGKSYWIICMPWKFQHNWNLYSESTKENKIFMFTTLNESNSQAFI